MGGIHNLKLLLQNMKPKLSDARYIFSTVSEAIYRDLEVIPLLVFREEEGMTIIVEEGEAEANFLNYTDIWSMITLTIHSDLSAVGFIAVITSKLAKYGISVNVVSAYYHDHIFVPIAKGNQALQLLEEFATYSEEELETLSKEYGP
ncbi:MAG: ACT domain-containing protein [Candidatus Heimdallarchaeota archaeon]|nr:MAG: ACT domain-containing protein [Candidatus Heimdallarchaeota archaeon]